MDTKKNTEISRLQAAMAIASFSAGIIIGSICLFFIEPKGEITNSALYFVSELLLLCGTILGVTASFDVKLSQIRAALQQKADKPNS